MTKKPQVSIIIPTFNRRELLTQTLLSIQKQSFKDWECIVVDDGSTDDTEQSVKIFINKDGRFKYLKRLSLCRKGASSCRNHGFRESTGKFIQWLDDDDLLSENKLELQVQELSKVGRYDVFTTCDWDLLWPGKTFTRRNILMDKSSIPSKDFYRELRKQQTFLPIHSFLMHRKLVERSGLWNIHLSLNDDAEFLGRILTNSVRLTNTVNCFVLYREHNNRRISREKGSKTLESLIFSFRLLHANLKVNNVESKAYFKMKLLKLFLQHWKTNSDILKRHKYFFQENGVHFGLANYYIVKHKIYKKVYPLYKQNLRKK